MEANETEISFERKTVENCYISEMRTIQPKIPALLERLSSIGNFRNANANVWANSSVHT